MTSCHVSGDLHIFGPPREARWEVRRSFTVSQPLSDGRIKVFSCWIHFGGENTQRGFFLTIRSPWKVSRCCSKALAWEAWNGLGEPFALSCSSVSPPPSSPLHPFTFSFFALLLALIFLKSHKLTEIIFPESFEGSSPIQCPIIPKYFSLCCLRLKMSFYIGKI